MTRDEMIKIFKRPLYLQNNLAIVVEKIYTDVNGTIVNKADVIAAIPELETDTPVYLFGEYDRMGSYFLGQKNLPPSDAYDYVGTFIYGTTNNFFFGANALTDLQKRLVIGDILQVYTDDILAPTYYIWVRLTSSQRSLASFMQNLPMLPKETEYGPLRIDKLKFYSTNRQQWLQTIQVLWSNYIGLVKANHASPIIFRGPQNYDNGFVQMNIDLLLSQYVGLNTYMLFETDSMTFNFSLLINSEI